MSREKVLTVLVVIVFGLWFFFLQGPEKDSTPGFKQLGSCEIVRFAQYDRLDCQDGTSYTFVRTGQRWG
ncbi:hypothetical protein A3D68_01470 [Candidatus Adlerbacteria bacterium RIFCSPHIGHO2_02_FULL_52_17]|uniref:Uncharacterized protein n=1 Tax=Candidatus Adlerbacteria bacterium RIFCSPHIGHO2_02_FULL_52_17 TaxID=1797240 RepID=A0A1F4XQ51_9BACT|nr:MAG: hypothetical protein A3D68_01470 [Candidatus Adlerbacteria bacterium RIFCSPHIGHO2_02_FULL_52_17]